MDYKIFTEILNKQIFDNSKINLIQKIAENPDRYVWLFRPTKPKAKILQNILQSNEICFWDALEVLFEKYFSYLWYINLEKTIKLSNPILKWNRKTEYLDLDQLFTDWKFTYFIEQKVRDDHDSSKKRWQIDNFERKIIELLKIYNEDELKCFTYFIDPSLIKNKNFYLNEIEKISKDYNLSCKLCYGDEFWKEIDHLEIRKELLKYLEEWKKSIPELPTINFDEEAEINFEEIKNINPSIFRKLFSNDIIYKEILPIIFPEKKVLYMLKLYFQELWKEKSIYKNLSEMIK